MKVGDKVVCLDDKWLGTPRPVKDEIYTIHDIVIYKDEPYLDLGPNFPAVYDPYYFRPVDDTFGEVVAETIEQQVELEIVWAE